MKKRLRLKTDQRRSQLLNAALILAEKSGYDKVLQSDIAKMTNTSAGLILHYFKTMTQFRRSLIREAIKQENLLILAQGLVAKDVHALKASDELKKKAIQFITK